ncbi:MAG: TetR/AcrR family transcriptional regulator [Clostridia bacterium]|nr:TetR/AcrR family transcriptional regulator [Clostridia bacterium]
MSKAESKFNNTAAKMNGALFRLIDRKDFEDITVSEVCKEAGVNRSTFYAHYDNTYDLLKETRDNFVSSCLSQYSEKELESDIRDMRVEEFVSERYILPYLKFVKENKRFFKIFISNAKDFDTDDLYDLLLERLWIPSCQKRGINDKTLITYMSKFYLNGLTAIVNQWISNDCEDSELFVCEVMILCVRPSQE